MPIIKGFNAWRSQIYETSLNSNSILKYLVEGLEDEAGVGGGQSGGIDPNKSHPELGWDPEIISRVQAMDNNTAMKKAEDIISLCRIKVFEQLEWFKPYWDVMPPVPFFGAGAVLAPGIGTMDTNGSSIRFCPKFVVYTFEFARKHMKKADTGTPWQLMRQGKKWFNDYATFVIIHEIMHNSLKHFLRTRQQDVKSPYVSPREIHRLWNLAQDYEINRIIKSMLGDMVEMFPGGVDHEAGGFKAPAGEEEFFAQSSSERIFYRLLRNIENKRMKKKEEEQPQPNPPSPQSPKTFPLEPGDIVELNSNPGEYGEVVEVNGDPDNPQDADVEILPISREEAMERTGGGENIIQVDDTGGYSGMSSEEDDELNRLLGDIDI